MRKIALFCAGGMSTSILMMRMREYAEKIGYELEVNAHSIGAIEKYGADADLILIGPQVRYLLTEAQAKLPNQPMEVIDMLDYGRMRGDKIVERVKVLLGDA